MASSFSSVFKINGVPILAPVLTDEVREEVVRYRAAAVELEQKLQRLRIARSTPGGTEHYAAKIIEREPQQEVNSPRESMSDGSLLRRGSFTLDAPSPGLGKLPLSIGVEEINDNPGDDESPKPRMIRSNSYTLDSPSPLLMKHMHNQSLNIKCSSSMGEIEIGGVKSHVKKLDFGGGGEQIKSSSKISSSAKPKWVSTKKVSPKPMSPVKKHKSPYQSSGKLVVGCKKKAKPVNTPPSKIVDSCSTKQRERSQESPIKKHRTPLEQTPLSDCQQRILDMQAEHERRVKELLGRQEEEQRKLQESFRQQQEELMKMLPMPLMNQIHTSTPLLTSPDESVVDQEEAAKPSFRSLNISSKDFANNNESQSSIGHPSSTHTFVSSDASRTSLEFENSDDLYRTCENNAVSARSSLGDANGNTQFNDVRSYLETIGRSLQDDDLKQLSILDTIEKPSNKQTLIRHNAASLINAYARGYLTRRLFQTEHVQKMVQVIRDTLLFVLDLHHEKRHPVRSPADLQLKRTLLQQLTSACYQLHGVFFETSAKERMAIIRRDRETMRRKLENRPHTASSVGSGRSAASSRTASKGRGNAYRKLQMCSFKY
ncbi:uncharacterized protein LOC134205885 isoform X2 [Armigeres subalbatus]|uniref:uncharacterized protein LOC134205885 isoform X2 n=1 Tax=Armigeres subalbatus TaxID=124917 RepID=UPI002ED67891